MANPPGAHSQKLPDTFTQSMSASSKGWKRAWAAIEITYPNTNPCAKNGLGWIYLGSTSLWHYFCHDELFCRSTSLGATYNGCSMIDSTCVRVSDFDPIGSASMLGEGVEVVAMLEKQAAEIPKVLAEVVLAPKKVATSVDYKYLGLSEKSFQRLLNRK